MKVLVVDDCSDMTECLVELLKLYGYEAHGALSGPQALQIAASLHPDSALIDIQMPGMDGFAVALALRHFRRDMLLIAVSGWPASRASRELLSRFDHYLLKPCATADLLRLLQLHARVRVRGAEGIKGIPVRGRSGETETRECADDPSVLAKDAWGGTSGAETPAKGGQTADGAP